MIPHMHLSVQSGKTRILLSLKNISSKVQYINESVDITEVFQQNITKTFL